MCEAEGQKVLVTYDLLVGAEGADSLVREAMLTAKPRPVRDFTVQTYTDDLGPRHLTSRGSVAWSCGT